MPAFRRVTAGRRTPEQGMRFQTHSAIRKVDRRRRFLCCFVQFDHGFFQKRWRLNNFSMICSFRFDIHVMMASQKVAIYCVIVLFQMLEILHV
jgi:hypothetical protein